MDGTKVTARQQHILDVLFESGPLSRTEIAEKTPQGEKSSKMTLMRDLRYLQESNLIVAHGKARSTKYELVETNPLLSFLDLEQYFKQGPDARDVSYKSFNPDVFNNLKNIFTESEIDEFNKSATEFFKKMSKHPDTLQRKELQRFIVEFSWKSSQIEGNTYSLLETESLIENRSEATGHDKSEAIMILNHKDAFDHVLTYRPRFKKISLDEIFSIHAILSKDLSIEQGIRTRPVRITGTRYMPLVDQKEIKNAMEKLIKSATSASSPAERALILLVGISYIQPFEDGNKRTSRMISNAVLLAHDLPPLSYRSVDDVEYKKACLAFYERNSLYHLKRIFVEQFRFARENYFEL